MEPDGEMIQEELYKHCQVHLVYMGKDQYVTLHRKPFIEQVALPSIKSMLEPMKIRYTSRAKCQSEPIDLSVPVCTSTDVSTEVNSHENNLEMVME